MYRIIKTLEIAGSHMLNLDYPSKCANLHGHNWLVKIYCASEHLDRNGMVVDFTTIKENIESRLDHHYLNDLFDFNPTAENIARWICEEVPHCYKVEVQESSGNVAIFEK